MDKYEGRTEEDIFLSTLEDETRNILFKVGSITPPKLVLKDIVADLQALAPRDDGTEDRSEEEIWRQIRDRITKAAYATRQYCIRCGVCCSSGSPTLLAEDRDLFVRNIIKPGDVVTIRAGEMVYSAKREEIFRSDEEMIKVREAPGTKQCVFYDKQSRSCGIYDNRPIQCRRQECWNPDGFQGVEDLPKLSRKPLLQVTETLWEIIQRHEERCSHANLRRSLVALEATKGQTADELLDLVAYDQHVRDFVVESLNVAPDWLDFFFGRPIKEAIKESGLTVKEQEDGSFLLTVLDEEEKDALGRSDW